MKEIYFIRHGKSSHNLDYDNRGNTAYLDVIHTDANLIEKGFEQSYQISNDNEDFFNDIILNKNYKILTSPLRRCITTALIIFSKYSIPKEKFISYENIREFPCGLHTPNKRINKSSLEFFYNEYINFDIIENEKDIYWNNKREETVLELDKRIEEFKRWIKNQTEDTFIVITHSSFMGRFLFNDTDYSIEHAKIYKYEL